MSARNHSTGRETIVLSPPGNPAAFPEAVEFLGTHARLVDWRFRDSSLESVHDIVSSYRDEVLAEFIPEIRYQEHAALLIACTGMSYGLPPEADHEYWQDLEARCGIPVATATRAVEDLWRTQGYKDMILVSPYDDRATSEAEAYWAEAGLPVQQTLRVQGGHPYIVTTADLERAINEATLEPGIPILLSGTGMRTKETLEWIKAQHDAPVWSVNQASAVWIQRVVTE